MSDEIIKKASELGLDISGNNSFEKLKNISEQLGVVVNENSINYEEIVNKLSFLENQKNKEINNQNINKIVNDDINNNNLDQNHNNSSDVSPNKQNFYKSQINQRNNEDVNKKINNQNQSNDNNEIIRENQNKIIKANIKEQNNKLNDLIKNKHNNIPKGLKKSDKGLLTKKKNNKETSEFDSKFTAKRKSNSLYSVTGNIIASIPLSVKIGIFSAVFIVIFIVIFVLIVGSTDSDETYLNSNSSLNKYIVSTNSINSVDLEDLTSELVYNGLCEKNDSIDKQIEDCLNSPAGQILSYLKEKHNFYYKNYADRSGNPINLNTRLILETISYYRSDHELFSEENVELTKKIIDNLAEAQVEKYQEYGDLFTKNGVQKDVIVKNNKNEESYYRISTNKYNSYLLYGKVHENYANNVKKYDVDVHPNSDSKYIPYGREYKFVDTAEYNGNIKDGFLYSYVVKYLSFNQDYIGSVTQEIIDDIYSRASVTFNNNPNYVYGGGTLVSVSSVCSGVIVTGDNAGVYPLEEYVAGVVQRENYWFEGNNIENMKAQAVAARTYVLRVTDNCKNPIENSQKAQTMSTNPTDKAIQAANETAGQVLTDASGKYLSTEYDAFCLDSSDDEYYYIVQKKLPIPKDWALSQKIPTSYLTNKCGTSGDGGHGRGMSQWGSRYLQTKGYTYKQILNTFYSDFQMASLNVIDVPSSVNDLRTRYYYNFDINKYIGNTLFGQCVWYAKHRAMEIIASANYDDATKDKLINSINNTGGNGQDWFASPDGSLFRKSTNISEPKVGSIVSWSKGKYGHVAIVEAVNIDSSGQIIVTITEGWRTRNSDGGWDVVNDLWSVANFRKKDLTLNQLRTYSGTFNGYVYLLGG